MFRFLAAVLSVLFASSPFAAELILREELLTAQRDLVTIDVMAVADYIGKAAHSESKDCDLHVPLRTRDVNVVVMGELKNACTIKPEGSTLAHWAEAIHDETHGRAVTVSGAFRIWLEHPGSMVHNGSERVPWYQGTSPSHVVEIHPITRIGSLDFLAHVSRIGDDFTSLFGPSDLASIFNATLTIERIEIEEEQFVRIRGPKRTRNHWSLTARVDTEAEVLEDGHRITVTILRDNGDAVANAAGLPAVTVDGTAADTAVQALDVGNEIDFQALIRMDIESVLDQLPEEGDADIQLPVEFILLDVN